MSTTELKINLINQITNISDNGKLVEIFQLLKFQSVESIFKTNLSDKESISDARREISDGKIIDNSTFQKEIKAWLTK